MASRVEVVLASGNAHKHRELNALLEPLGFPLVFGPERLALEVEESGKTYAENALIKACAWSTALGMPALADDSGLEVEMLDSRLLKAEPLVDLGRTITVGVDPQFQLTPLGIAAADYPVTVLIQFAQRQIAIGGGLSRGQYG